MDKKKSRGLLVNSSEKLKSDKIASTAPVSVSDVTSICYVLSFEAFDLFAILIGYFTHIICKTGRIERQKSHLC